MITDRQVFADDHIPDALPHRDGAVDRLARAFEPALRGDRPDDVLIHGPHGVGKTVLAQHTFSRLEQRTDAVSWMHIRSMGKSTAGIVRATLQGLGADPAMNTPREDLCLQLRQRVSHPTIVVLDEGDDLDSDPLRRLTDVPQIALVPIIHDLDDWLARVDDDIRRRLTGTDLHLDRYTVDELVDILQPRVANGLRGDVERDYLAQIADRAAGVAREAIQTLRAAAEIADGLGEPIERVSVETAYQRALADIRRANLQSLTFHHHVLYELLREHGPATSSELYDAYDRVEDEVYDNDIVPVSRRHRRNKLDKLATYKLIDQAEAQHDTHEVCDASIASDLVDIPPLPEQ